MCILPLCWKTLGISQSKTPSELSFIRQSAWLASSKLSDLFAPPVTQCLSGPWTSTAGAPDFLLTITHRDDGSSRQGSSGECLDSGSIQNITLILKQKLV